MNKQKSQRFVHSQNPTNNKVEQKTKLPPIYLLTGVMILILTLVPISGSIMLILWGVEVIKSTLWVSILLISVGVILCITIIVGTIIFAIYYFTNDSERKLREIKYKDKVKLEDVFIKCEKCGATLLVDSEVCTKCGHKLEDIDDNLKDESKINDIKQYFLDTYNFEITDQNMDIINSYFNSKFKTFEYSYVTTKKDEDGEGSSVKMYRESILNKFLFNFKKIIVVCSITLVVLLFAFLILGKYIIGL